MAEKQILTPVKHKTHITEASGEKMCNNIDDNKQQFTQKWIRHQQAMANSALHPQPNGLEFFVQTCI